MPYLSEALQGNVVVVSDWFEFPVEVPPVTTEPPQMVVNSIALDCEERETTTNSGWFACLEISQKKRSVNGTTSVRNEKRSSLRPCCREGRHAEC